MNFNLEYYRAFFTTATFLSFTKAADHLCLTQSAVSQSVKKLEAELNCELFDRSSRGLKLTKEGEIIYSHVKKAFQELQLVEEDLMNYANMRAENLKIGATETPLRFFLMPQLSEIKAQFPNIHITLAGSTIRDTCKSLQSGDIELAFLISPIPPEFQFHLTRICEIQDIFVASRQFPIDFEIEYNPAQLSAYPFIAVSGENSVRAYIEQWFLENNVIFAPEFTVRGTGLILPLVENSLGIGIMPQIFVEKQLQSGDLVQVKTTIKIPPRVLYLATNPDIPLSAASSRFIKLYL